MTKDDLLVAAEAAGWKPEKITALIKDLDPNHEGDFNLEEFILILKYIEQKNSSVPQLDQQQSPSQETMSK